MDTKMKNEIDVIQPTTAPPPYPGPPTDNTSQPSYSEQSGLGHPAYPGHPTTSQPHFGEAIQMTGVHMTTTYPGSTTIIQGTTVVPVIVNSMGPNPVPTVCKSCHQQIITRTERRPSMRTHFFAVLLCILLCWPCMCIPYCVDSCNNADHYCTNCNAYIGSYIN